MKAVAADEEWAVAYWGEMIREGRIRSLRESILERIFPEGQQEQEQWCEDCGFSHS